jgi:putative transcriptional regulator
LQDDKLNANQIRFFLGYSGWANEQLEQELEVHSWVVAPNVYKNDIIGKSNDDFWKEKMIEFGGDYMIWSNAPENPNFN